MSTPPDGAEQLAPKMPPADLDSRVGTLLYRMKADDKAPTVADAVAHHAAARPDAPALGYLRQSGEAERVTFAAVYARMSAAAAALSLAAAPGHTVVLMLRNGVEFAIWFLACQRAGLIPVPAAPSRSRIGDDHLIRIVRDCDAKLLVVDQDEVARLRALAAGVPILGAAAPDADDAADLRYVEPEPVRPQRAPLAFLQYTSGSTGHPKGVMVTHENLLANVRMIATAYGVGHDSRCVSWLPTHHDMGLVGTVLMPLIYGLPVTLMSPTDFMRDPMRWLSAISRLRADIAGGPNFAYDLLARRLGDTHAALRAGLDLSSWRVAFAGAEPVRPKTLIQFAAAAAPYGFRPDGFQPSYGLAECTLYVDSARGSPAGLIATFDAAALEQGEARPVEPDEPGAARLVACGMGLRNPSDVTILDADGQQLPERRVGEIAIDGAHVSSGYWSGQAPPEHRRRAEPYRTRDAGFLFQGRLFVIGRLDDVLIVRGRNLYPSDVEETIGAAHPGLPPWRAAVFDAGTPGTPKIVAFQEIMREGRQSMDAAKLSLEIRRAVLDAHGVSLDEFVLLRPGTLPLTSSGKVRRRACRELYAAGAHAPLAWSPAPAKAGSATLPKDGSRTREDEIRAVIAETAKLPIDAVDIGRRLSEIGLDSLQTAELVLELESRLGLRLDPGMLHEDVTIADLAAGRTGPSRDGYQTYWADAALPSDETPSSAAPFRASPHEGVLVTGATGLVGGQVLRQLVTETDRPIWCLIRSPSPSEAEARLRALTERLGLPREEVRARVIPVAGDIERPGLGLDEETRADLQRSVGWIVHAAAKLDFLRPYSRMRAANVDGVRAVIELCGGGRPKRLVHLSSVSVLETPRLAGRVLDETASLDWPDTLPTGYARTKWVADRMVLHAARRGLQAHIIRPPWIAGSAAGTAEASADFLLRFIAACARMEAIPDTVTGWHVVTADFVARAVLLAVDGRLPPGVWHTGSPDRVGMDDIASALRARGVRTARSPQETWLKRVAEAAGRDPHHPFAALAGLFAPGGAAWLYGQGGVAKMDCERTLRALADHRVRPGPIDVDALAAAALARFPPSLT